MSAINNDKNVYLLGAGFSKEIGLPLQDDFLLTAKEVFFKNPDSFRHFERVFEYQDKLTRMKKFLNYPLLNLEHLFNLIEMDIFYSNNEESAAIKSDFIKLICDVLIDKTPCPFLIEQSSGTVRMISNFKHYLSFISLLIKEYEHNLVTHEDTIISFNYDLVLEGAVSIYNWKRKKSHSSGIIKFNTLFGMGNITEEPVSDYFTKNRQDAWFPPPDSSTGESSSVKLIKLHGSINWEAADDTNSFIVPPTWNKSDERIRKLWDEAYQELKAAKRIIIIGYSFPETDIYVKSLLALALNENKILQNIYFINPDKDVTKRASLSLLDKYFEKYCDYKEWKFSTFIGKEEGKTFVNRDLNRQITT